MSRYMIEKVGKNDYNLYRINDEKQSDNFLTLELLFPEKIVIEKKIIKSFILIRMIVWCAGTVAMGNLMMWLYCGRVPW